MISRRNWFANELRNRSCPGGTPFRECRLPLNPERN